MSKVSIKIVIAGRSYPLTVKEDEEESIRAAANEINSNIQRLQASYAVKDMQDLLAMTSLQLASRKNRETTPVKENGIDKDKVLEALLTLSSSIEE